MRFLNNLLYCICMSCYIAWWYLSQLTERWRLREGAFGAAGDMAGRCKRADDLRLVPFLHQSKAVFDKLGWRWSSKEMYSIRHLETIYARYEEELYEHGH
jgi:hypothetical protein